MKPLTAAVAALMLAVAQAALSEPSDTSRPLSTTSPRHECHDLKRELNLNNVQMFRIYYAYRLYVRQTVAQRAENASGQTLTPDQRLAQKQQLQNEMLQKLDTVLTPVQLAKLKDLLVSDSASLTCPTFAPIDDMGPGTRGP
jgi:hypothetical protein